MTVTAFLLSAGGLLLLFFGGETLLRGAVGLALRFDVSPLLIGLTIVALATSMPELMVTLTAGFTGVTDVGVGNVVGSNIANILLILGATAVLSPVATQPRRLLRDMSTMVGATLLFVGFALLGSFGLTHGLIMLAVLAVYLGFSYQAERQRRNDKEIAGSPSAELVAEVEEMQGVKHRSYWLLGALVAGGVAMLILGSEFLIDGAVEIARAFGISETVIGLTLVAVGTSLPELATALVAGARGHAQVALGNVIGSNIFNVLLIVGLLAAMVPFAVARDVIDDLWIMIAATLLVVPVIVSGHRISRIEGLALLAVYGAFIWYQFLNGTAAA